MVMRYFPGVFLILGVFLCYFVHGLRCSSEVCFFSRYTISSSSHRNWLQSNLVDSTQQLFLAYYILIVPIIEALQTAAFPTNPTTSFTHSDLPIHSELALLSLKPYPDLHNNGDRANASHRRSTSRSTPALYCIYHFLGAQRFHPSSPTT